MKGKMENDSRAKPNSGNHIGAVDWEPPAASFWWRTVGEKDGHHWGYLNEEPISCFICGEVRRADGKNRPCDGPRKFTPLK